MAEKTIQIPDYIAVRELADLMDVSPINIIKELMASGIMANINQEIDYDTAAIVAEEMGFEPVPLVEESEDEEEDTGPSWREALAAEDETTLVARAPIITMLGHVDHGKTSLLDAIRQTNVQEGEAGGITQHIGAYQAKHDGQLITVLDTPGHEAFTAMRARGAQATDIAILVVAADDGVMPQTREAIDHAKAARVPIIVALNKVDLATAQPERVKQELSELGLTPDDWDGDTLVIPVSATEKLGMDDLLEAILLTAEDVRPRANPNASPTGTVLEARTERGRGVMTTVLVQNGTLKVGDTLLIGDKYGRIRAMIDFHGNRVDEAGPSTPVSVSGLNEMPQAGEQFRIVESEKEARSIISEQEVVQKSQQQDRSTLEEFFAKLQSGESKTFNVVVKADVQGSLEPVISSLEGLENAEVDLEILRSSTGRISENDVLLASASSAIILGFNVDIDNAAEIAATSEGVDIRTYNVIYHMLEDVERLMKGMMDPTFEKVLIGRAEVRQVFEIRKVGQIAGCYMRTGEARRNGQGRLIRDRKLIHEGAIASLKHLQDDVRSVKSGFEFGVNLEGWDSYQEGDIIEFFVVRQVAPA